MATGQYVVGFGLYAECVGAYDTFHEALRHYAQCKPRRGYCEARRLHNGAQCDYDSDGLTDEQQAAIDAVELGDPVERVLARYDLRCFALGLAASVWRDHA